MDNKHTTILITISLLTIIVTIASATWAYFASTANASANVPISAESSAQSAIFLTRTDGEIAISVDESKMDIASSNNDNTIPELTDNAQIILFMNAAEDNKISTCSYDIIYELNDDSNEYIKTPDVTKEFTITSRIVSIQGVPEMTDDDPLGKDFIMNNPVLNEINIDKLSWQTREVTKQEGDEIITKQVRYAKLVDGGKISSISKDNSTIVTYEFEVKFYNADKDQSVQKGKNYGGIIHVDNKTIAC